LSRDHRKAGRREFFIVREADAPPIGSDVLTEADLEQSKKLPHFPASCNLLRLNVG
jgi:hypothetical protein